MASGDAVELPDGIQQSLRPARPFANTAVTLGEGERILISRMRHFAMNQRRSRGILPRTLARVQGRLVKDRIEAVRRQRDRHIHPKYAVSFGRLTLVLFDGVLVSDHEAEQKIIGVLGLEGSERRIAICGVPDEAKGEALLLLSDQPIEMEKLRSELNKAKVPNLWIPKRSIVIENIPVLASGKLDIRRCQELAAQNS